MLLDFLRWTIQATKNAWSSTILLIKKFFCNHDMVEVDKDDRYWFAVTGNARAFYRDTYRCTKCGHQKCEGEAYQEPIPNLSPMTMRKLSKKEEED